MLFVLKEITVSTVCHTGKLCIMGQNQRKGLHVKLTTKGINITQLVMANDVCPGIGKGGQNVR